ncbi:MAG: phosphoribosylamine--glycine ligase [Gammaproteobacteria bacterium]|nr:phosphoribosylamine--glycine ligase [Gammaproteobacteria bacterium]
MKVLIIGGGGREHALAWKAAQSPRVEQVFVAPGNAGTAREAKVRNVAIGAEDIPALFRFAQDEAIDLTIVGPEAPLVAGAVDTFRDGGLRIFGPSRDAAQLEGSKAFTKDFLARHHIPTARYGVFTEIDAAVDFIHDHGAPIVVKADGLAAGKGVILAQTRQEAIDAVKDMLAGNAFGEAGHRVVIEEFLAGEEASFICMVDGTNILPMASSQDHKARDNGDRGPNTGGMGAYSPAPVVDEAMHRRVMQTIIQPTIDGMAQDGSPFTGFLYAGLMISPDGEPKVLEYNVRFGDPETQPVLMRLRSSLAELCLAAIDGRLDRARAEWDPRPCLGVVLAAGGYPGRYESGRRIHGLDADLPGHVKVFHAGTRLEDDVVLTAGCRVLCVCALGETVTDAQAEAYAACDRIGWDGVYRRNDIGYRAVERERSA